MLRYLRKLADKDLALDRTDDPARLLHDEAQRHRRDDPGHLARVRATSTRSRRVEQTAGYRELIDQLEADAGATSPATTRVSLQPNSGAQGEYAGLLAIRAYHRARGEGHRNVCLIPASAHGTNPASAQMAGMQVVVVTCDANGNVDLRGPAQQGRAARRQPRRADDHLPVHARRVRGRRHARSARSCTQHGGQVYMDGANMNAQVGLAEPGEIGARRLAPEPAQDLLHPARRRRPRRGPDRRWRAHLAPFLPGKLRAGYGRGDTASVAGLGRAVRLGQHPADLVDVHRA